jgi:serine/threonine-protein kinase
MLPVADSTISKESQGGGSTNGPKPGDLIADRYRIERFIGRGGMAEVFAGVNIRTGKRVALKWIRPALATTKEALARFRREAMAAGRINHPNVVTVFDVVEHKSATWLIMELLEGDTLSEILTRVGYMEPEPAIQLLIPAMRGVAAAHAHGVVHRDLKPDNIFICRSADGQPREAKVLDFGVSKLTDEPGDQVRITVLGHPVGTPAYMAPEQVRGNMPVDARSDVYALGVVLYQMLAGRRPFPGQVYSALMVEIATTDPPQLTSLQPSVPPELGAIVHKAMAREIEQRFPDVSSFIQALEELIRIDVSHAPTRIANAVSGRILLTPLPPAAATGESSQGVKETLKAAPRPWQRVGLVATGVVAFVLLVVGIKILAAPRATDAAHARGAAAATTTPTADPTPPPAAAAPTAAAATSATAAATPAAVETNAAKAPAAEAPPAVDPTAAAAAKPEAGAAVAKTHARGKTGPRTEVAGPTAAGAPAPRPSATAGSRAGKLTIDDF